MTNFLVFYSRTSNEPRVETIADDTEAVQRLLEAERELANDPLQRVVLLVADDLDDLRRTHAHYFTSIDDLLRQPVG